MNSAFTLLVRAAIWLLLFSPFVSSGQTHARDTIPKSYRCGADHSSKFKIASDGDCIYYLQDDKKAISQLYRVNTVSDHIDSFDLKFPYHTDLSYDLTAMDVSGDTLVLCYGDNIHCYKLSDTRCIYLKHMSLSTGEVIFSVSLHQGRLYLSCDRPDKGQKHRFRTVDMTTGAQISQAEYSTHLATLTTFGPSHYYCERADTIFYYDNESFQLLTVRQDVIDTILDVRAYFDSNNIDFVKATAKTGLNERDHYIMNKFGNFSFDFIHEVYVSDSKIFLFYFPANHSTTFKLERKLCVIDRPTGNHSTHAVTRTKYHGLVDFQSVTVGDQLYIVSNHDHSLYIQEYSTLNKDH